MPGLFRHPPQPQQRRKTRIVNGPTVQSSSFTADAEIYSPQPWTRTPNITARGVYRPKPPLPPQRRYPRLVPAETLEASFTADALLLVTQAASFTADAELVSTLPWTRAANIPALGIYHRLPVIPPQRNYPRLIPAAERTASFTADAILLATTSASFTADAIFLATTSTTFTADAVLVPDAGIIWINRASAGTNTVALPTFRVGDLGIVSAVRTGNDTPPSLATGWTNIDSSGANLESQRVGYRILQAGDTDIGVWTNSSSVQINIFRRHSPSHPIGNFAAGGASSADMTYTGFTLIDQGGTSWVLGVGGHRTATNVGSQSVTGMTTRSTGNTTISSHTAENVASFSTSSIFTVNTSSGWRTYAIEVRLDFATFTADAVIKAVQSASFTADAIILATLSATFTANAVVLATQSATFTANAVLVVTQAASFSADAIKLATQSATFTADAVLLATQSATFSADAVIAVLWLDDDFNRTVDPGWGTSSDGRAHWVPSISIGGSITAFHVEVDGSAGTVDPDPAIGYANFVGWPAPLYGTIQWDFFVPSDPALYVGYYVQIQSNQQVGAFALEAGEWEVFGTSGTNFVDFTPDASTWYTFKANVGRDAPNYVKVWKRGDPEPDWMASGSNSSAITTGHVFVTIEGVARPFIDNLKIWSSLGTVQNAFIADAVIDAPRSGTRAANITASGIYRPRLVLPPQRRPARLIPPAERTATFTADAIVLATTSVTFTADAVIKATQTATFTADAVILRTQTATFTADAVVLATSSVTFTADAVLLATQSASFTADAVILTTVSVSFTGDAVLVVTQSATFTSDAILKATISQTFTADAVILATQTATFTADAILLVTQSATFTADAILLVTQSAAPTADAVILATISVTFSADAVLLATQSASFTADAILVVTQVGSFAADAVVLATQTATFTADAVIKATITTSFTADAYVASPGAGAITLDAILFVTQSATFTADAVLSRVGRCVWTTPGDLVDISATPTLAFIMPPAAGPMHFHIELDRTAVFDTVQLRSVKSHHVQTGWEYWDGGAWQPVLVSGVDPSFSGNEARYTLQTPLITGLWFRRVRAGVI